MTRPALLIIDMQVGAFGRTPKDKLAALVARLNGLAERVRKKDGVVVFVQHDGPAGDPDFHPSRPGWHILPELDRRPSDRLIHKTSCDSFLHTELDGVLKTEGVDRLVVTGCATDYCVDTTVRSALGRGYQTIVPSDGHMPAVDRPHLTAAQIIAHHNAIWADFLSPAGAATVCPAADVFT